MIRISVLFALVLGALVSGIAPDDGAQGGGYVPPASPPPEYQALYTELETNLAEFEADIDAGWDGGIGTERFAAGLSTANGNKSAALLLQSSWDRIIEQLDAFEAMGVGLIKMDMQYPVLTPAFHTYLAANPPPAIPNYTINVSHFIGTPTSFYNRLADEIHGRGLDLWIEHSTLFGDFTATPPAPYFADMRASGQSATQARYISENAAEHVLIVTEMEPDYYTILDEPTTQADNFGLFPGSVPIFGPTGWGDAAESWAEGIVAAAPGSATLLGAGSGTWEGRVYTENFAAIPGLDYIDFHIYPFETSFENFLQNALDWADYVRGVAPEKKLTLGETWLYKESAAELEAGLHHNVVFGRDVYSFWEPLDREYFEVIYKLAQYKDFEITMPFWSQYYFAYLTYGDPELEGLSSLELMGVAAQDAIPNIQTVTLTGLGQKFAEIVNKPPDADGDGTPDVMDNEDADSDGVSDKAETFCGGVAIDGAMRPERTDAVFAGIDDDGDGAQDEGLPSSAPAYDCDGDGYVGTADSHVFGGGPGDQDACGVDGWPADLIAGAFSGNRVNTQDLATYLGPVRHLNTDVGANPGNVRWDVLPGGGVLPFDINVQDLATIVALAPPMLGGVKAFNGPACPWAP